MTVFKCKMCGGTIEFEEGASVGVCDYCGTRQTLPRLDDDRRSNLYDRANHFRRNNEYDKAMGIYEQILSEDPSDAEAYWSLLLCCYGIEYVEDPATHKRVPTVNRAQFTSIFDDDNYKSAIQYADALQKEIYEEEAKGINEIQKGILAISQKEEPYDVFICYKETDDSGRRTPDSVIANDLYHQLTQEGFKTFFSRITLEDKLGTAYEPYIFAALNSAKVMVALGTKPEHFNAVWVKNEWSRFLTLVKQSGGKKRLIPAYRDMDPYDLPEEFSHLQAQDMSKLGFMQDLIRGIKKIVGKDEPKNAVNETVVGGEKASIAPLLKRAFMFLEDGNWDEADSYCEKVLDQDPENAEAYLGKLMAELRVRRQEDLANRDKPFGDSNNYKKAIRFGDESLASALKGYSNHIIERNENNRRNRIYDDAVSAMRAASTEKEYKSAAAAFAPIVGFKDTDVLIKQSLEKAEVCRKDAIYDSARSLMSGDETEGYENAIETFRTISGWKDADEQIYACQRKIEEIKAKEEADRLERERQAEQRRIAAEKAAKKRKRIIAITAPIVVACIAFLIVLTTVIIPQQKLNKAIALIDSGEFKAAYLLLDGINYKNSKELQESIKPQYQKALLAEAEIGSYVVFGAYEQDNNTSNGKEDIEWIVLAREGDRVLVVSRYALDYQQYNTSYTSVTWETCSLRKWLNGTFLNAAFSENERAMIPSVTVSADKNQSYSTSPGNSTTDQVFLLSITEANKYFSSDSARQCSASSNLKALCYWWLRSPDGYSNKAAIVDSDGSVTFTLIMSSKVMLAVRPALWIDIEP